MLVRDCHCECCFEFQIENKRLTYTRVVMSAVCWMLRPMVHCSGPQFIVEATQMYLGLPWLSQLNGLVFVSLTSQSFWARFGAPNESDPEPVLYYLYRPINYLIYTYCHHCYCLKKEHNLIQYIERAQKNNNGDSLFVFGSYTPFFFFGENLRM